MKQALSRTLLLSLFLLAGIASPGRAQGGVDLRQLGQFEGNPFAPVQIIEFADIGCSACGLFHRDVKPSLQRDYIDSGRVGWRMVMIRLSDFANADQATRAMECSVPQGAFFKLEQMLYDKQREWQGIRNPDSTLAGYVQKLGLDVDRWRSCYRGGSPGSPLAVHNQVARTIGVRGTPTFLINNKRALGALSEEQFRSIVEDAEREAFQ